MPTTRFRFKSADRAQRLRRQRNAERDAETLARLRQHELSDRIRQQNSHNQYNPADQPVENAMDYDAPFPAHNDEAVDLADTIGSHEWVDLVEEPLDEIDLAMASERERHRHQARNFNWNALLNQLYPEYMKLKGATQNWAGPNCYNDFHRCTSTYQNKTRRSVDFIGIHGQARQTFTFCECTLDAVKLLQLGYIAASPVQPQTAFSLPLLIFHNHLWNRCHVGALPFMEALNQFLEPRSQRLYAKKGTHARPLRKPFSAAVDLFRQLEEKTDKLIFNVLKMSRQDKLAHNACPACFGPETLNSSEYSDLTRNKLIVCLDGNFQHRHQTKASRNDEQVRIPPTFLRPSAVDEASQEICASETLGMTDDQTDRCTESHKAADDKRNESTWKGCDDTGLMGCCCRHDAVLYFANIYKSGEKRHFPMAIIKKLLADIDPDRPVGFLYDIGCSLDKYIRRVCIHNSLILSLYFQ
ncbi:hypothetical protein, variant [Puccinia triticina 1-1 BBBD Race 1]|uniref:CxC1 domain-containing protein n=1 Tax=Puccinia triticina (isolate 1-1 / race 1 (BBBD)) TaxID=630390 RepID=A0A180GWP4_PUCT1|nr:hypothetical protein, variant [Puccinia triticina 1-1 BBBD Race 1]